MSLAGVNSIYAEGYSYIFLILEGNAAEYQINDFSCWPLFANNTTQSIQCKEMIDEDQLQVYV